MSGELEREEALRDAHEQLTGAGFAMLRARDLLREGRFPAEADAVQRAVTRAEDGAFTIRGIMEMHGVT